MKTETYKKMMDAIEKHKSIDDKVMITFDNMVAIFIDEMYNDYTTGNDIICKCYYEGYLVAMVPVNEILHIRLIK